MPDLYCQSCKQTTPHKSVMRRSVEEASSFTQKFAEFLGQIASGKHYYKMEPQHYCRICNCQHIGSEPVASNVMPAIRKTSQVSLH